MTRTEHQTQLVEAWQQLEKARQLVMDVSASGILPTAADGFPGEPMLTPESVAEDIEGLRDVVFSMMGTCEGDPG